MEIPGLFASPRARRMNSSLRATPRKRWGILSTALLLTIAAASLKVRASAYRNSYKLNVTPLVTVDEDRPVLSPSKFAFPASDAASCQVARKRVPALQKELALLVDVAVQTAAENYVAHRAPTSSVGEAWDEFAMGLFMAGDAAAATWSELKGLSAEWDAEHLGNAGVFLIYLSKPADGQTFLNCAYSLGDRSPYLFEALSTASRQLGRNDDARSSIDLAEQLTPADPFINIEQYISNTGGLPPSSPPQQSSDQLEIALSGVRQHAQNVINVLSLSAEEYNAIAGGADKEVTPQELSRDYSIINTQVSVCGNAVKAARSSRDDRQYNRALVSCVHSYIGVSVSLVGFFTGYHEGKSESETITSSARIVPRIAFWAKVLYMDRKALAQELKNGKYGFDFTYVSETQYRERANAAVLNKRGASLADNEKFCGELIAAYTAWEGEVSQRLNRGAAHFDTVAQAVMLWGQRELLDTRGYAVTTLANLKPITGMGSKELFPGVNAAYGLLVSRVIDAHSAGSLAANLEEDASWFKLREGTVRASLALQRTEIENYNCSAIHEAYLKKLAEDAYEEYLKKLQADMLGDIQAGYDATANCEVSMGPVTWSIDDSGKTEVTGKFKVIYKPLDGKIKTSFKNGQWTGVSVGGVTVLDGLLGGKERFPPFVGKADGTLFLEHNPHTGKLDGGIAIKGALGLGAKGKILLFGKPTEFGIGCYPGKISAKFYARAFYDHVLDYVKADISGTK